jgi:hypothetical protein
MPTKIPNNILPIKMAGVDKISLIPFAPKLRKLQTKSVLQTPSLGTTFPPRRDPMDRPTSPNMVVRVLKLTRSFDSAAFHPSFLSRIKPTWLFSARTQPHYKEEPMNNVITMHNR